MQCHLYDNSFGYDSIGCLFAGEINSAIEMRAVCEKFYLQIKLRLMNDLDGYKKSRNERRR